MQDNNWQTTEFSFELKNPWQSLCLFLTGVCCGIIATVLWQHFSM